GEGYGNTAFGDTALFSNIEGNDNTAVGRSTLARNTTGNGNIAVGANAGLSVTRGDNNIYLGNTGGTFPVTESNTIRLGTVGTQTSTFIAGIAGATVANSATVLIDTSTGRLGTMSSSIRYKRDIQPMGAHSHKLLQLRPVIFRYTQDAQGTRQYG